jgi:hypothetical protein
MAILIALLVIGLAGFAAYAYLRVSGIATESEERLAAVFGIAFALVLGPESPVELVAELVAFSTIALGLTSIAHLAVVALRDRRAAGVSLS